MRPPVDIFRPADHDDLMKRYEKHRYVKCPICDYGDLIGDELEHFGPYISQEISCVGCGSRWIDRYTVSEIVFNHRADRDF